MISRRLFLRHLAVAPAAAAVPALAAQPRPPAFQDILPAPRVEKFDYEAAIEALEAMGVQLGAVYSGSRCDGFAIRTPWRRGPNSPEQRVLSYERGFCPYRLGEALARQGKFNLPRRA